MKNILGMFFILFSVALLHAQQPDSAVVKTIVPALSGDIPLDTIIRINGDTLVVSIKYKDYDEVIFVYPFNKSINKVTTPTVTEMRYSDGVQVVLQDDSKLKKSKQDVKQANLEQSDTTLTINKIKVIRDVAELPPSCEKRGDLITDYKGDYKMKDEQLERNGISVMKRKAIRMGANLILIRDQSINRPYGEIPTIEIKGTAYYYKP